VLWLLPAALAGTPVIYDGPSALEVLAQVTGRTGLPADQLTPVAFRDLIAGPPATRGAAVLRHCASDPVDMTMLRTELARAEAAWQQSTPHTAMDHLDLAVAWMSCLTALAEPAPLARLFLLRGALLAEDGQTEAALDELNTALSFQPVLEWDPSFPAAGEELLAQALSSEVHHTISLTPDGSSSGPWLDGHLSVGRTVAVRSGLHLVQAASTAGIRSAWLIVRQDADLIIPTSYQRSSLSWVTSAEDRDALLALLQASHSDLIAAYIAFEGGLWLMTSDGEEPRLTQLEAPPAPPPAPVRRWWQWRKP